MTTTNVRRLVRLTARLSAALFTAAEIAQPAVPKAGLSPVGDARAWQALYRGFMAAHATHFVAVAWLAKRTRGQGLFPGRRDMQDVGGWPTLIGIDAVFSTLAVLGLVGGRARPGHVRLRLAGRVATGLIAATFAGTYFGQAYRARWPAAAGALITAVTLTNLAARSSDEP